MTRQPETSGKAISLVMISRPPYNFGQNETDLSAFQEKTPQETWVPPPFSYCRRQEAPCPEKEKRSEATRPGLISSQHLTLFKSKQDAGKAETKWRIAIPRKVVRLATQRNRWKRRVREILRRQQETVHPGYLGVIKIHSITNVLTYAKLEKEMLELFQKSGLISSKGL